MKTTSNMLKHAMAAITMMGVCCTGAVAGESPFDIVAGYHWLSPKKDKDWKNASGIEIRGRLWQGENLGLALVAASDTWKAKSVVDEQETADTYVYSSVSGDASVTSFGASLCYRSEPRADVKLIMDMGLRYALVDSSLYGEAAYDGPGGPNYLNEKINIENTILFVLGAGLEFEMTRNVALIVGVGYQVDLQKPQETFAGQSLGETSLDAVSYTVALACSF